MSARSWKLLGCLVGFLCLAATQSRIEYLPNVRDVQPSGSNVQNYLVVDGEIWDHARPDLGDLRLYDGSGEVPYSLQIERAESNSQQNEVKLLNLGKSQSATEFVIDADDIPEYDNLTLVLDAKDFVTEATVEGADELPSAHWTRLTSGTLFDFSREKLGNNFTLRFQPSRFRYMRVRISSNVEPGHVKGASVAMQQQRRASWTPVPALRVDPEPEPQATVRTFKTSWNIPVERMQFLIRASAVNFRRDVEIRDNDNRTIAHGTVTRIRMKRGRSTAEKESLVIDLPPGIRTTRYTVIIHNGDDRPLPIEDVQLLSLERRIYFTPTSAANIKLYYGDGKLTSPSYDYAKLFAREENAGLATLGARRHNPQYIGRPDDRPWSERQRWVLWGALIIAVLGLGAVALRSLKAPA
jgi:hypothetical protein